MIYYSHQSQARTFDENKVFRLKENEINLIFPNVDQIAKLLLTELEKACLMAKNNKNNQNNNNNQKNNQNNNKNNQNISQ